MPADAPAQTPGERPRGLRLAAAGDRRREQPKPLGMVIGERPGGELIGLTVADARHHVHVAGVTGSGKSTWLAWHVLAEAAAGRGVVLLDCQGDLSRHVLERLPASCAPRLVILDPAETNAPPAWNVLAPAGPGHLGREWAAENVVAVFRRLYAGWWGPRMDDLMRAACLSLARRPGSTIADIVPLLTSQSFRRALIAQHGEPPGLGGYWSGHDELSPGQRAQLCGPVLSRLRAVLARRFARDLLGVPQSTINLTDILNGGILIARLAKGEIGEDTARLVGSLLLSGLWAHATRRSAQAPQHRPDATIVVDECHNFLNLPIGVEDALAEARGYRLSLVLAHQHLGQLSGEVQQAIDANARNKVFFTVSPTDAHRLARHVTPYFDEHDLSARPAFQTTVRVVHHGHDSAPFSLATLPLPPAVPGRAEALRAAAAANAGLSTGQRRQQRQRLDVASTPAAEYLRGEQVASEAHSPGPSPGNSPGPSLGNLSLPGELPGPEPAKPQLSDREGDPCAERDWN